MERCGSIILLGVLLPYVCGIPFSLHTDGSETTRVCKCDSVDFWLPRRRESSLELPSYEELTPSLEKSLAFDKKGGRYLRLRLQKDCKHISLNKDEGSTLNGDVSFKSESLEDGSIEVWLKDGLKCMSFWMKCHDSQRSICVGIDVLAKDFSQSMKRKLLMVVPDEKEDKISYGHYGIIMSAFVLCLMVILVALCGSSSTNSAAEEVYTGEETVEIISSAKVQSIPRQEISTNVKNEEKQETDVKNDDHTEGVGVDRSSTNDPKAVVDHGKVSVAITDNGAHKDATDGQVFVKEEEPEKESKKNEKRSEKEKSKKEKDSRKEKTTKEKDSLKEKSKKEKGSEKEKNKKEGSEKEKSKKEKGSEKEKKKKEGSEKEKNKKEGSEKEGRNKKEKKEEKGREVRPGRAHSSPAASAEQRGFPKLRLSLKANASPTMEDRKSAKKEKKKGKSKSLSDVSPSHSPSTTDRRSFVHRELPQTPSQGSPGGVPGTDYAEPFDCKARPKVVPNQIEDMDEDGNYETVTNQMTGRVMVSARNEVLKSCRNSSGATASRRQVSATEFEDDDIFYDSVDEKKETQRTGERSNVQEKTLDISDTYEVVEETTKQTRSEPTPEADSQDLYEIVDSRNTLDVYEEPQLGRKRSASDIVTGSSSTMTETGHKSKSLDRNKSTAPPLPPLPGLQRVTQGGDTGHVSGESEAELIEPYTLTTKKGDFIFQETSTSLIPNSRKAHPRAQEPLSPEELEVMYTKVDKEKQKIDRLKVKRESDVEMDEWKKDENGGDSAMGTNVTMGTSANTAIAAIAANDNHEYESIQTLKRKPETVIEGEDLYDEVIDNNVTNTSS